MVRRYVTIDTRRPFTRLLDSVRVPSYTTLHCNVPPISRLLAGASPTAATAAATAAAAAAADAAADAITYN